MKVDGVIAAVIEKKRFENVPGASAGAIAADSAPE